jgi:hypothetical protein
MKGIGETPRGSTQARVEPIRNIESQLASTHFPYQVQGIQATEALNEAPGNTNVLIGNLNIEKLLSGVEEGQNEVSEIQ